jgi:hypothetical protein
MPERIRFLADPIDQVLVLPAVVLRFLELITEFLDPVEAQADL